MDECISVVMAVYNGRRYLKQQLDSIMAQTCPVDEIVIIDDCSQEDCRDIIDGCLAGHPCALKYRRHEVNKGYAQTFLEALRESEGDYIFLADQDDIWERNKVETCLRVLRDNPQITCMSSLNTLIDGEGNEIKREKRPAERLRKVSGGALLEQRALRQGMTLAIRRRLADRLRAMDTSRFEMHDKLVEYVATLDGGFWILGEYLNRYRIHSNNTSGMNLSHFKLRTGRQGRIDQIDKEVRYLEMVAPLEPKDAGTIERCLQHYALRRRILQDRRLVACLLNGVRIMSFATSPRVWLGDVASIVKG